jgi:hypothetical protein
MNGAVPRYLMITAIGLAAVGFVLLAVLCDQARWVAIPMMAAWVGLVALTGGAFQRRRIGTAIGGAALSFLTFVITFLLVCNEGGRNAAIALAAVGIPTYALILAAGGAMLADYGETEPEELTNEELSHDWTLVERGEDEGTDGAS